MNSVFSIYIHLRSSAANPAFVAVLLAFSSLASAAAVGPDTALLGAASSGDHTAALRLVSVKGTNVNATGAERIAASNPGCMLQLRAGVEKFGHGQRVSHVVEILDEAYRAAR